MSDRLLKESDVLKAIDKRIEELSKDPEFVQKNGIIDVMGIKKYILAIPSADRPKHYCAECKFEPIDKRCMPCSSCTNNPKNRDAFVSCEVEKKGADDGADNI